MTQSGLRGHKLFTLIRRPNPSSALAPTLQLASIDASNDWIWCMMMVREQERKDGEFHRCPSAQISLVRLDVLQLVTNWQLTDTFAGGTNPKTKGLAPACLFQHISNGAYAGLSTHLVLVRTGATDANCANLLAGAGHDRHAAGEADDTGHEGDAGKRCRFAILTKSQVCNQAGGEWKHRRGVPLHCCNLDTAEKGVLLPAKQLNVPAIIEDRDVERTPTDK